MLACCRCRSVAMPAATCSAIGSLVTVDVVDYRCLLMDNYVIGPESPAQGVEANRWCGANGSDDRGYCRDCTYVELSDVAVAIS